MASGTLNNEQERALVEALAEAVEQVIDTSACLDMLPLYLMASQRPRRRYLRDDPWDRGLPPLTPRLAALGKASRSKYNALAAWRQVVLWRGARDGIDQDYRAAMDAIYFTPFPANRPPYSWSKRSSCAPRASDFSSPNELDRFAREGCWETLIVLKSEAGAYPLNATVQQEAEQAFIEVGVKRSLRDVLRLEEQWDEEVLHG